MTSKDLQEHQIQLSARLKEIAAERGQIIRKLKAIKILLEGMDSSQGDNTEHLGMKGITKESRDLISQLPPASSRVAGASPRSGLIEIVRAAALKQPGT